MCPLTSQYSAGDAFQLERFVLAQERVYGHVLSELRAGEKMGHWM